MKYQVVKEGIAWYGYKWNETYKRWDYIDEAGALTKVGCKYLVNKYHKKLKSNPKIKFEEFELE